MSTSWNGPIGPVTIKTTHGDAWVLPCLASALQSAARRNFRVVDRFPSLYVGMEFAAYAIGGRAVMLFDETGLAIPLWRIEEERLRLGEAILPRRRSRLDRFPGYDSERDFRNGPVPGVHRGRWRRSYRRVRTQGERRDLFGLEADLRDLEDFPISVKIRGRRKNVPTLWDDIQPARRGDGWKAYRKTQWKEKAGARK
jgi:hypothetical protein